MRDQSSTNKLFRVKKKKITGETKREREGGTENREKNEGKPDVGALDGWRSQCKPGVRALAGLCSECKPCVRGLAGLC